MSREFQRDGNIVRSSDGYVLNAEQLAKAHAKMFKAFGPAASHEMSRCLTAFMMIAIKVCDAKEEHSDMTRTDRAQAAMDYLRAMADGADQLFAQVKAKGN